LYALANQVNDIPTNDSRVNDEPHEAIKGYFPHQMILDAQNQKPIGQLGFLLSSVGHEYYCEVLICSLSPGY
jgi:hypothetical protein